MTGEGSFFFAKNQGYFQRKIKIFLINLLLWLKTKQIRQNCLKIVQGKQKIFFASYGQNIFS